MTAIESLPLAATMIDDHTVEFMARDVQTGLATSHRIRFSDAGYAKRLRLAIDTARIASEGSLVVLSAAVNPAPPPQTAGRPHSCIIAAADILIGHDGRVQKTLNPRWLDKPFESLPALPEGHGLLIIDLRTVPHIKSWTEAEEWLCAERRRQGIAVDDDEIEVLHRAAAGLEDRHALPVAASPILEAAE